MPDELEYIVSGALTHCNLGSGFMPLNATSNNSVHIQRQLVATELDRLSLVNIPSYGMCSKSCAPCSPAPVGWIDTYEYIKVKGNRPLIFKSSCMCTLGGKIEFLTSGQVPLDQALTAESLQSINEANEQSNEAVEEYEAEKDAVGESGIAEGFIPVWGSGRDAVNSFQTGHWGWGIFHSVMVAVDVVTLGTGSIVKGGVKGLVKGGVKLAAKETGEAITKALTKKALAALAAKEAAVALFKKGAGHIAEASIKYLGVCIAKACFAPGTPVAVAGGYKPIEELQSGDEVWAYNEDTGETALKPVLNVFEREADTLVALTIDGEVIHTTPEHPFFADGSWKAAGLLQRGDTIQLRNGKAAVVQNVCYKFDEALAQAYGDDTINSELFSPLTKVFNLEVEDWHTYFVGNNEALVHNTVCVKELLERIVYGILKGEKVMLKGFRYESITYIKRGREELDRLRKAFNTSERKNFLSALGKDSEKVNVLKKAGMGEDELKMIKDGKVPDGYQVHHKKPLDDSGDNSFDNLILMKNDPYHKSLTNLQNGLTKGMAAGDTKIIEWPIHDGFIYY